MVRLPQEGTLDFGGSRSQGRGREGPCAGRVQQGHTWAETGLEGSSRVVSARESDLHPAGGWERSQLKGWTWHRAGPAHCPPWSPWRWLVVLFC